MILYKKDHHFEIGDHHRNDMHIINVVMRKFYWSNKAAHAVA